MDPGIDKMMELAKRQRMDARMPPVEEVEAALRQFVKRKKDNRGIITDTQAQLMLQSLMYYEEHEPITQKWYKVVTTVLNRTKIASASHVALTNFIYAKQLQRGSPSQIARALDSHIKHLCLHGSPDNALALVLSHEEGIEASPPPNHPKLTEVSEMETDPSKRSSV